MPVNSKLEPLAAMGPRMRASLRHALPLAGIAFFALAQQSPLRGKNLGLLRESGECEAAQRSRRAAATLGAHVAHIRPDLSPAGSDVDVMETGRMLGRLYDGIECVGLDPDVARRLGAAANVPCMTVSLLGITRSQSWPSDSARRTRFTRATVSWSRQSCVKHDN